MEHGEKEAIILDYLLRSSGYLTAVDLANKLAVSEKTIYRTINNLNVNCFGEDIIKSYIGKGYKIDYDKYMKTKYSDNSSFAP